MRDSQEDEFNLIRSVLTEYHQLTRALPGLEPDGALECYIRQLIDSKRRVRYVSVRSQRQISASRADPSSHLFDPLLAAIHHQRSGDSEEAFWLIYIFTHFGLSARTGWALARAVYGGLGQRCWSWHEITHNLTEFQDWIDDVAHILPGGFGNHRKYESKHHIGRCMGSYVEWVRPFGSHAALIAATSAVATTRRTPHFQILYNSLDSVLRFGRTAKFDYLAMLGKTRLVDISPNSLYLSGSTGPIRGARMMFGVQASARVIDAWLMELAAALGVGAQEMEDSICNWQKSPLRYKHFRG
jgi:hypothetical protein